MTRKALIVGLGNPGKSYEKTRHNVGFVAVELLAKRHGLVFQNETKFQGAFAYGNIGEESVILLKPLKFMNLSGEVVAHVMRYYEIDLSRLLVIADDVDLPLGQLRIKINSGPGTHNGLKSVEHCLQTQRYPRLRVGIGDREEGELADYVLSKFTTEEEKLLPVVLERAVETIERWLDLGLTSAMNFANTRSNGNGGSSTPSIGEKT